MTLSSVSPLPAATRVVIVDDHPMVAEGIEALLESYDDIQVLATLSDGRQIIDQLDTLGPDLILMDLSMPVLGGLEATRLIRQFENETKKSACRIVALTANAQPSDVEACLSVGMDDFLSKPFRKSDL
ncbi:MAG: response regulator, partial [Paracoccaceae bacterium]